MKQKIRFNWVKRKQFNFFEKKNIMHKTFQFDEILAKITNNQSFKTLSTKTKNLCIFSGRARSVLRGNRLSRILVRTYADTGQIYQTKRLTW